MDRPPPPPTTPPHGPAWLRPAMEYGPLLLFLGVFLVLRGDTVTVAGREMTPMIVATLVFIPAMAAATLVMRIVTGAVSTMQGVSLAMVVVLGGMTIWLNDPRFFKMKPTLFYLVAAATLGLSLALRRNWLGALLGEALPLTDEGWRILTGRMAGLFAGLALLNEFVWRTQSETVWVWFKIVGLTLLTIAFLLANAPLYRRYAPPEAEAEGAPPPQPPPG